MAYQKINFKRFIKESQKNKQLPYSWLLGAGMSVSSGIPLATEISKRLTVFEYLLNVVETKPWNTDSTEHIIRDHTNYEAFFHWWNKQKPDEQEKVEKENELDKLEKLALEYIHETFPVLKEYEIKNPLYYQHIFEQVLPKTKDQTTFLSSLIRSARGINLSTLGLAGLLRDFPEMGQVVFMTNFDDLLLQATLSLGHTARAFTKGEIADKLHGKVNIPQIVYLHGKHTDYNCKNSDLETFSQEDRDEIVKVFINSNVVILGYSGWPDIARSALEEIQRRCEERGESILEGRIFWVPYKNDEGMSDEIRALLNAYPPGDAFVVVNDPPETPLDADTFMMLLCQKQNPEAGGIATYRNELLKHAERQHDFIYNQLKDSPFDPKLGLEKIQQARTYYKEGKFTEALQLRKEAKNLILEDIPGVLKAEIRQELGLFDLLRKKYTKAEKNLIKAFNQWQAPIHLEGENAHEHLFNNRLALAECMLRKTDFYKAKDYIVQALIMLKKEQVNGEDKAGQVELMFAALSIYKGDGGAILPNLNAFEKVTKKLHRAEYPRLFAHYNFFAGIYHYHYTLRISKAIKHFTKAAELYEIAEQENEKNNALKYLADIGTRNNEFKQARHNLEECYPSYEKNNDYLGMANVKSSLGDLHFQRAALRSDIVRKTAVTSAVTAYREAIALCEKHELEYNLVNNLADLVIVYQEILQKEEWGAELIAEEEYQELRKRLETLTETVPNAYGKSKLKTQQEAPQSEEIKQAVTDEEE